MIYTYKITFVVSNGLCDEVLYTETVEMEIKHRNGMHAELDGAGEHRWPDFGPARTSLITSYTNGA